MQPTWQVALSAADAARHLQHRCCASLGTPNWYSRAPSSSQPLSQALLLSSTSPHKVNRKGTVNAPDLIVAEARPPLLSALCHEVIQAAQISIVQHDIQVVLCEEHVLQLCDVREPQLTVLQQPVQGKACKGVHVAMHA